MITSLYLEGFKSFGKPVTIDFRDITLLYGENSSGKSSILQALQYAREVFCNGNLDCLKTEIGGDFVDLRGFRNFVHGRDESRSVKIGITVEVENELLAKYRLIDCSSAWPFVDWMIKNVPLHDDLKVQLKNMHEHLSDNGEGVDFALPSTGHLKKTVQMTVGLQITLASDKEDTPEITSMAMLLDKVPLVTIQKNLNTAHCKIFTDHNLIPAALPDANQISGLYTTDVLFSISDAFSQDDAAPLDLGSSDPPNNGLNNDLLDKHSAEPRSKLSTKSTHWNEFSKLLVDAANHTTYGWKDRVASFAGEDGLSWQQDWAGIDMKQLDDFYDKWSAWPISALVWEEPEYFNESDREGMPEEELAQLYANVDLYQDTFNRPLNIDDLYDLNLAGLYAGSMMIQALNNIKNHLSGMRYIGPLRSHYTPPVQHRAKTDERSWADGLGAWDHLAKSPDLLNIVNKWICDPSLFGFDCTVETSANLEIQAEEILREFDGEKADSLRRILRELNSVAQVVIKSKNSYRLNSTDIGVGFSQILPIIVAARGPSPACILLEQPELHIHVRLQAVLADLLATGIVPDTPWRRSKRQFIVETHSEALLLRLMRRIRETTKEIVSNGPRLLCDHVAIYHISKQDGNSIAKKIELDTYGNLTDEWPDDLFDISFKERFGE